MRATLWIVGWILLVSTFVLVAVSQPAGAASGSVTVSQGYCAQINSGDSSTSASSWSLSASGPFEATVSSSTGSYGYGTAYDSSHQGNVPGPGNYFFFACNVCPGGDLAVDYSVPSPVHSGYPRQINADQFPHDLSQCAGGGSGSFDLDALPLELQPVLAPLALGASVGTLALVLTASRGRASSGIAGRNLTYQRVVYQSPQQPYQAAPAAPPPSTQGPPPPEGLPPFIGSEGPQGQPVGGVGVTVGQRNVPPAVTSPDYERPPPGREPRCWLHPTVQCAVWPAPVGPGWYSRTAWWCPVPPPAGHWPWGPNYAQEWLAVFGTP